MKKVNVNQMIKSLKDNFNVNAVSLQEWDSDYDYEDGLWIKTSFMNLDIKKMDEMLVDFDWNNYAPKGYDNEDGTFSNGTAVMPEWDEPSELINKFVEDNGWMIEPYDSGTKHAHPQ